MYNLLCLEKGAPTRILKSLGIFLSIISLSASSALTAVPTRLTVPVIDLSVSPTSVPDAPMPKAATAPATAIAPDTTALPLAGKTIVIDPGHGGADSGAVSAGVMEKTVTLAVSLKLRTRLEALGATVIMTRATDKTLTLQERRETSNRVCPDLFLSVHGNSVNRKSVSGIETYWWDERDRGFAGLLLKTLVHDLHEISKWTKPRNLFVLVGNNVPASLVEIGYLTNPRTRALLTSPAYQDKVASALAESISVYLSDRSTARGCALSLPSPLITNFVVRTTKEKHHAHHSSHHRSRKR